LHTYKREFVSSQKLAEEACSLEIDRLGEPVGKQDQYIAAFGNVTAFTFSPDGSVEVQPVPVRDEVLDQLETHPVIVWSGIERPARVVLREQGQRIRELEPDVIERMHTIKELGREVYRLLVKGDIDLYGELLHHHWTQKRKLASKMTDAALDEH